MKILIIYATKYGCTKKCSEILKSFLDEEVEILSAKSYKIDLTQYDVVLIGGSVYMGKIRKEIIQFYKRNKKQLKNKRIGLFVCCYTPNGTDGFLESLFPKEMLEHAFYATCVGGEMNYRKMNCIYRKMFQSLKKIDDFNKVFTDPTINKEEIRKLAYIVNKKE